MCVRVCLYACNQSELWVNWGIQIVRACMCACALHNERKARELGLWDVRFNRVWMFEGFVVVVVDSLLRTCTQHALACEVFSDLQQESCAKRSAGTGACREGRRQGIGARDVWWAGRGGGGESSLFNDQLRRTWWEVKGKRSRLMALERFPRQNVARCRGHWCHCEVTCGL